MAVIRRNFLTGNTSVVLSAGGTTLTSADLAALPVVAAPDYAWISLDPLEEHGLPEIVKVTAHSSGAVTATIQRAAQAATGGGSAREHPSSTFWAHAPTGLDLSDAETALAAEAEQRATGDTTRPINTQTNDYTLVLADAGKVVEANKATAINVTVPPNASEAFPTGTIIEVNQVGAGLLTVVAGAGVTLNGTPSAPSRYGSLLLRKRATNEWTVTQVPASGLVMLGAVVVAGDTTAQIQAKADACAAASTTLGIPAGSWTLTATVSFLCSVDADPNAVFTSDANPVVQIAGTASYLRGALLRLPRVRRLTKNWGIAPGPGAGIINSDVGVKVQAAYACEIHVPESSDFSCGLWLAGGISKGTANNKLFIGELQNCAVSAKLTPADASGWVNENQFFGGVYSIYSGEGSAIANTRAISIPEYLGANTPNNNIFFGGNLEGDQFDYHLECWGDNNLFIGMRWEAAPPKVWWRGDATRYAADNLILGGYKAGLLTTTDDALARRNGVLGSRADKREIAVAGDVLVNEASSEAPVFSLLEAGDSPHSLTVAADYRIQVAADHIKMKRKIDAWPRVFVDGEAGYINLGNGSADPVGVSQVRYNGNWALSLIDLEIATAGKALKFHGTDAGLYSGTGTPEGAVAAPVGSIFLRRDGGAGTTLYIKEMGSGNTGWTPAAVYAPASSAAGIINGGKTGHYYTDSSSPTGAYALTDGLGYATRFRVGNVAMDIDRIGCEITTAVAATSARLGNYLPGSDGSPNTKQFDAGTVDASTTGAKEIVVAQSLPVGLNYLTAASQGGAASFRCRQWGGHDNIGSSSLAVAVGFSTPDYRSSAFSGAFPATFDAAPASGVRGPIIAVRAV